MSSHEQALVSLFSPLALSFDGAILGLALAYAAVLPSSNLLLTLLLDKLRVAPSLSVSDLRSLLDSSDADGNSQDGNKLVVVRGTVEAKSVVESGWKSLIPSVLVSRESGDSAVAIQRTQTIVISLMRQRLRSMWILPFRHEWKGQQSLEAKTSIMNL
ncbi:E3 ubiquitin-protein ligase SPL2-like [Prosopis cineraria]|uniref:E3 ubiquitin-protein ligase SPL2-like n=1 Tax=Prosopis cineraria TaxID=364024 RepID=UPI0024106017|nr:E3 ubiquitin-protein ligase SPL2-like [Prosopis cineraria]